MQYAFWLSFILCLSDISTLLKSAFIILLKNRVERELI